MTQVSSFISIEDAVSAMKFDYDLYLLSHIQHSKRRRPMSTVFEVYPVMVAIADEILATKDEDKKAAAVVSRITNQGVDIIYATKMAASGRNRLLTALDHGVGGLTFKQIEGGSIDICDNGDALVTYNKD